MGVGCDLPYCVRRRPCFRHSLVFGEIATYRRLRGRADHTDWIWPSQEFVIFVQPFDIVGKILFQRAATGMVIIPQNNTTNARLQRTAVSSTALECVTSATLAVKTSGIGFTEFTQEAVQFVNESEARDGVLMLFLRHTSASLAIQENADRSVQADLLMALDRMAPL